MGNGVQWECGWELRGIEVSACTLSLPTSNWRLKFSTSVGSCACAGSVADDQIVLYGAWIIACGNVG